MQQNWSQRENHVPALLSHLLLPPRTPLTPLWGLVLAAEVRKQIRSGSREITGRHRLQIRFCWLMSSCFLAAPPDTFQEIVAVVFLTPCAFVLHSRSSEVLQFFYFKRVLLTQPWTLTLRKNPFEISCPFREKHLCLFSLRSRECSSRCACMWWFCRLSPGFSCPAILRNERKRFTSCGVVLVQPGLRHTPQPRRMNGAIVHLVRP